jgi:hypothetical protein
VCSEGAKDVPFWREKLIFDQKTFKNRFCKNPKEQYDC